MTDFTFEIIILIGLAFLLGVIAGVVLRTTLLPQTLVPTGKGAAEPSAPGSALTSKGSGRARSSKRPSTARKPAPEPEKAEDVPAAPQKVAASAGEPDNLQNIKGVGAVIEKKLNEMGITRFQQIAEWTEEDIAKVDSVLNFRGRIGREKWVEQAKKLAAEKASG